MNYDALFTPFKIGRMEVKNRIVMSPMGTLMANRDGTFSENEIAYYEERARGGTGMIICGQGYLNAELGQGVLGHALTIEEIAEMMKLWEYSAGLVRDAGFDAIEVHAHVGYLVDQFLSPIWNKRTDEYGGSPENRTRFATDIVDAIHRGAGSDFPVIFRLSLNHRIPGGRTLEDSIPILRVLDRHGCDAFNVDAGSRTPESAVRMIESGRADFAVFGRQLIADPELGRKLLENRVEDVRPCMRCNEECIGRIIRYRSKLSCAVNPAAGDENAMRLYKTDEPKTSSSSAAAPEAWRRPAPVPSKATSSLCSRRTSSAAR